MHLTLFCKRISHNFFIRPKLFFIILTFKKILNNTNVWQQLFARASESTVCIRGGKVLSFRTGELNNNRISTVRLCTVYCNRTLIASQKEQVSLSYKTRCKKVISSGSSSYSIILCGIEFENSIIFVSLKKKPLITPAFTCFFYFEMHRVLWLFLVKELISVFAGDQHNL